jgi:hypothetical protein
MWAERVTINTLTIIPRTRLTLIMLGGSSHRPLSHDYPLASTLAPASAHHVSPHHPPLSIYPSLPPPPPPHTHHHPPLS